MPFESFWKVLPSLSGSQLVVAVVLVALFAALVIAKILLVPGVARFAARQKKEFDSVELLKWQIERDDKRILELENDCDLYEQKLKLSEETTMAQRKRAHKALNQLQVFCFAYDHAEEMLIRLRELCGCETLAGESLPAIREVCHESRSLKTSQQLMDSVKD